MLNRACRPLPSSGRLVFVRGAKDTPLGHPRTLPPDRFPPASPLRIGKILLPVDFSERCREAAGTAGRLARRFDAQLTLVHVRPRGAAARAEAETQLQILAESTLASVGAKTAVIDEDDTVSAIVGLARGDRFDLIVMPTYGNGPFCKLTLGSVTERVVLAAQCPVWTTAHRTERIQGGSGISGTRTTERHRSAFWFDRETAESGAPIQKIVCAVDRDSRARQVLRWARGLALAVGADLTVVHAISSNHRAGQSHWSEELRRDARAALSRRLEELHMHGAIHVETGEVTPVVGSAVENLAADLLVIGKRSDVDHSGSVISDSYSLIRQSRCPVVSV